MTTYPPKILFKYRNWSDSYHQKLITDLEIFFASPNSFNDPFDFQITYRYDKLTEEDWEEKYHKYLLNFTSSGVDIEKIADSLAKKGPHTDPREFQKSIMNSTFGIVSLSGISDSILLWSHYANNHRGFCVGFDSRLFLEDLEVSIFEVDYVEKFPEILPTINSSWLQNQSAIMATKFKAWEYENEYRLVKSGHSNKVVKLSNKYFKSLIIGCAMPDNQKKEILNAAKITMPHIEIFQAQKHDTDFKILLNKIK